MWRETEEFSLTKAVEDVGQHSYTQTQALKEKEKTLSMLQVHVYSPLTLLIFFLVIDGDSLLVFKVQRCVMPSFPGNSFKSGEES